MLTRKSSRSMMDVPGPMGWIPASRLGARAQGVARTSIRKVLTRQAFLRLMPVRSRNMAMIFSKTPITVDMAAKDINTKKREPHKRPSPIWLNILGSVMKIRLGPASGSTP